jgi:hypothetical protein
MSVIIKVYSDHGLTISDYLSAIQQIERLLDAKIEQGKRPDFPYTDDEERIVYFTQHDYFSKRFEEGWAIWIYTNYRVCDQIRLYKYFTDFETTGGYNLKTHLWREQISGKALIENREYEDAIKRSMNDWDKTRSYINMVSKRLLGSTILYLNDSSGLHRGEDLIWEGNDIETVLDGISKISIGVPYNDLSSGSHNYSDNNWFFDKV